MPILFIASLALQILCGYHVVKSGQDKYWLFLIIIAPGIGCLIYAIAVMLPSMSRSNEAKKTMRTITKTLDPTRNIRSLQDKLSLRDTPQLREQLANEYIALGQSREAVEEYQKALVGPNQSNPDTLLKLANAYFDLKEYAHCLETLTTLLEKNPSYVSQDGHLLQARALHLNGSYAAANEAFQQLITYYSGPQALFYYAEMLCEQNRNSEAKKHLDEILSYARIAPPHYTRFHKTCLSDAKKLRKTLN